MARRPAVRRQSAPAREPRTLRPRSTIRSAGTGLALAVSNPQAILFYVAILPAVIRPGGGVLLYLALAATLGAVMTLVAGFYIALGARARTAAGSPTARRRADQLAGAALIAAGAVVAAR